MGRKSVHFLKRFLITWIVSQSKNSHFRFWIYILSVWTYFGCLDLYFGCLNLYFGCLNLYRLFWVSELILWASEDQAFWVSVNLEILKDQGFRYDLWIWKYWRTKHSGMTRESGNTERATILVWPVNVEILKDQVIRESGNTERPTILVKPAPLLDKQDGGSGGR